MLPIFRCVLSGRITNMLAYLYLCACVCIVYSTTINTQKCANQITTRRNHLKNTSVDMFMNDLEGTCSVVNDPVTYPEDFVTYSRQFLGEIQKFKEAFDMRRKIAEQVKLILEDSRDHAEYKAIYDLMLWYSTGMCLIPDCKEIKPRTTGVNKVYINGKHYIKVICNMDIDGGNWTVIQQRQDGSVDFFRTWQEYKEGFGNLEGEFWLGNENIHKLTSSGRYELRVDLGDWEGNSWYAVYSEFKIGNEHDKYRLSVSGYKGTAGDSLKYHNQMEFSTKDQDNDDSSSSCSNEYKGAWWYQNCYHSNLNGLYLKGDGTDRVTWKHAKNKHFSMKFARMMIRRY